jgi:NitT/TauT family transport system ATP-binding protein
LHIEDLYQAFGDNMVLDNVDLSVQAGEFVSVVGPSGCGKSTLLRVISGQDIPRSGSVLMDGKEIGPPDVRRGVVYQQYSLFPHLSVVENVLYGYRRQMTWTEWRRGRKECRDEVARFLSKAGIADQADKYPYQLSGGQRQRVAIVRALIYHPQVLLMDEPFSALDTGSRENMQMWLLELWKEYRLTILFVTHDLNEAIYLGTRPVALSQYYTDDRGDGPGVHRGAKIVLDRFISPIGHIFSPLVKGTREFTDLKLEVKRRAFDPEYRQHVDEFDLNHPHSWRTLTAAEKNGKA